MDSRNEGATMTADEVEFLATFEMVTIIPNFGHAVLNFLETPAGPFRANDHVEVPLWLARDMKKLKKCQILKPDWMDVNELERRVKSEREGKGFEQISYHFLAVSAVLLEVASDDIPNSDRVRSLIADIVDLRQAKIKSGLAGIDKDATHIKLTNISSIELISIRDFLARIMNVLRTIKTNQAHTAINHVERRPSQQQQQQQSSSSSSVSQSPSSNRRVSTATPQSTNRNNGGARSSTAPPSSATRAPAASAIRTPQPRGVDTDNNDTKTERSRPNTAARLVASAGESKRTGATPIAGDAGDVGMTRLTSPAAAQTAAAARRSGSQSASQSSQHQYDDNMHGGSEDNLGPLAEALSPADSQNDRLRAATTSTSTTSRSRLMNDTHDTTVVTHDDDDAAAAADDNILGVTAPSTAARPSGNAVPAKRGGLRRYDQR